MGNYENIRLEKGMYGTPGKSFTQVLEDLDPTENYAGTPLEKLDAYQRQLKRFDIHASGPKSDRIEKFFQTSDSAALFPEYVARSVQQGMEADNLLPSLVATKTMVDAMDYRTLASVPTDSDKSLLLVAEGAVLPQTVVHTKSNLVHLLKCGRMLVASYEAIRFQRLDLFSVMLKQIGAYISRTELSIAIEVLLYGDDGKQPTKTIAAAGSKPVYSDMIELWGGLSPYRLNTMIGSTASVKDILSITEFRDAQAGLNFQGTGKLVTPLGANLLHDPDMRDGKILGLDKTCALEMVQAGGVQTDFDRLIDRQLERAGISTIVGFSRILDDAVRVLTYDE